MSDRPARSALVGALGDWRRHALALVAVAVAVGGAVAVGTDVAFYTAVLFAFSVWMAWFVLTAVDWLRRAEF